MKRTLRTLAEVGVGEIFIGIGEMTDGQYKGWKELSPPPLQPSSVMHESPAQRDSREWFGNPLSAYIVKGMVQSGSPLPPILTVLKDVRETKKWCRECDAGLKITPHPNASVHVLSFLPSVGSVVEGGVAFAIGCERGWTEEEVESMVDNGWRIGGMGIGILRAETAAVLCGWAGGQ